MTSSSDETSPPGEVTRLLRQLSSGDRDAEAKLVQLVYEKLRHLAAHHMRGERPDHTLEPTALVHEAYLKLVQQRRVSWQSRGHFYCIAAQVMRRILIDRARRAKASKRAAGERVPLE